MNLRILHHILRCRLQKSGNYTSRLLQPTGLCTWAPANRQRFVVRFTEICVSGNSIKAVSNILVRGCMLISSLEAFQPAGDGTINHKVCDAWPVRRQTYGDLPSFRAVTVPSLVTCRVVSRRDEPSGIWAYGYTCGCMAVGQSPRGRASAAA